MWFYVPMMILSIKKDRGRQRMGTAAKLQASIAILQDHGGNHNATERWVFYSLKYMYRSRHFICPAIT